MLWLWMRHQSGRGYHFGGHRGLYVGKGGEPMSKDAPLPCIVCGTVLRNVMDDSDNQPSEGTEFRSFGHYGSTFWDSFAGEEIVINICDACLRTWVERVARQKRYVPLVVTNHHGPLRARTIVGRQWVTREMVPYFNGPEDEDEIEIEVAEIGTLDRRGQGHYGYIEWVPDWRETKARLMTGTLIEDGQDGVCKHVRHLAECLDCGAQPLQGLR